MYWYYKVVILGVVAAILYGLFSIVSPYLPEMPSFSKPASKEEANTATSSESSTAPTNTQNTQQAPNTNVTATKPKPQVITNLNAGLKSKLTEAKDLYKRHQRIDEAYEIAAKILVDPSVPRFSSAWYEVADFISDINTKLSFSSAPSKRKINHQVKRGDSLSSIAGNYTTIRGLQRGNNIPLDSGIIHPGDVIRLFPGNWEIEVVKTEYILILKQNGQFFKYYKVGIGKEDRTPEGKFKIYGKVEDPIWEKKDGQRIQPGDSRNVLGTRWMKLKPIEGTAITGSGYGIHGTTQPNSVGTPASQGCIRMRNSDVEELFDIIPDVVVEVIIRK
ncbi:MAG: L,D-transpeptidase family protein [Lentisphaeraceae bacterium]|nr:L,D-transpeptidase family protein [Lentisphaeraceae bacterium]